MHFEVVSPALWDSLSYCNYTSLILCSLCTVDRIIDIITTRSQSSHVVVTPERIVRITACCIYTSPVGTRTARSNTHTTHTSLPWPSTFDRDSLAMQQSGSHITLPKINILLQSLNSVGLLPNKVWVVLACFATTEMKRAFPSLLESKNCINPFWRKFEFHPTYQLSLYPHTIKIHY